jgi:hypothetical protein
MVALGHRNDAIFEVASRIAFLLGRQNLLDSQIPRLSNHHLDCFSIKIGVLIMCAQRLHFKLFEKHEIHVPAISNYLCHNTLPYD